MIVKFFILLFYLLVVTNYCYDYNCDSPPKLVQLQNGLKSGIVSQPSYCYNRGFTVMAQNNDQSKNIEIQFTIVPSNFKIKVYDGKIDDGDLQNCQIQNGSTCFSTGNTVTFYFVPTDAFGDYYNNRVEIVVTPYIYDYTSTPNSSESVTSFSIFEVIFCAFLILF